MYWYYSMSEHPIIDSHIHCGIQKSDLPVEKILPILENAKIIKACIFSPVEDIYDRTEPDFIDNNSWIQTRNLANNYILEVSRKWDVIPYYFVWNDFAVSELDRGFRGIKWHRHAGEPNYDYKNPECEKFLQKVFSLHLPIVLEEDYANTINLIERIGGRTRVIIPHMGMLNGGYQSLKNFGIWECDWVYADTALANISNIIDFIRTFGPDRILFGSDYPFGRPERELRKILDLTIPAWQKELIVGGNIISILNL